MIASGRGAVLRVGVDAAMDSARKRPPPRRLRKLGWTTVAGTRYPVATTARSRLLGLALLARDRASPGLLLTGCRSVHTFGMRFRLDVYFLDDEGRFVSLRASVPPGRIVRDRRAAAVLEVPARPAPP
jgi:uncharacterized membrane protein (UPF0127 family)